MGILGDIAGILWKGAKAVGNAAKEGYNNMKERTEEYASNYSSDELFEKLAKAKNNRNTYDMVIYSNALKKQGFSMEEIKERMSYM